MKLLFYQIFVTFVNSRSSVFLTNDKIVNEEHITITLFDSGNENSRHRRESDACHFPPILKVNLTSHQRHLELFLRQNNLQVSVPFYTLEDNIIIQRTNKNIKRTIFYTDVDQMASIGIQCSDTRPGNEVLYLLNGMLVIEGQHHIIRSRSVDQSSGGNVSHVLLQTEHIYNFSADFKDIPERLSIGNRRQTSSGLLSSKNIHSDDSGGITHYKVELLPVCDYAVYTFWYNQSPGITKIEKYFNTMNYITEYYAYLINAINVHYKSIKGVEWDIEVVYTGIYIAASPVASTWTENIKEARSGERMWVDGDLALQNFKTWLKIVSGLPDYDHAMSFTGYEMYRGNYNAALLGLAWTGGLCWKQFGQYFENSIVEDLYTGIVATVAAHELGHNLGAQHDGENNINNCSASNKYIMAASIYATTDDKATNHYIFSNCSVDYFQSHIEYLDQHSFNCMTSLSVNHDPTALDRYNYTYNGEIYDPDDQCKQIQGDNSQLCRNKHYADPTTVCKYIYCVLPNNPGTCSLHLPWDGISCGDRQWCIAGECNNDTRARSADPKCVFGDASSCEVEVTDSSFLCYQQTYHQVYCCLICQNYYTGIPGCEYGDRENGCLEDSCPFYTTFKREVTCCKTCSLDIKTTTETTTNDVMTTMITTEDSTTAITETTTNDVMTTMITTEDSTTDITETTTNDVMTTMITTEDSTTDITETTTNDVMTTMITTEDSTTNITETNYITTESNTEGITTDITKTSGITTETSTKELTTEDITTDITKTSAITTELSTEDIRTDIAKTSAITTELSTEVHTTEEITVDITKTSGITTENSSQHSTEHIKPDTTKTSAITTETSTENYTTEQITADITKTSASTTETSTEDYTTENITKDITKTSGITTVTSMEEYTTEDTITDVTKTSVITTEGHTTKHNMTDNTETNDIMTDSSTLEHTTDTTITTDGTTEGHISKHITNYSETTTESNSIRDTSKNTIENTSVEHRTSSAFIYITTDNNVPDVTTTDVIDGDTAESTNNNNIIIIIISVSAVVGVVFLAGALVMCWYIKKWNITSKVEPMAAW